MRTAVFVLAAALAVAAQPAHADDPGEVPVVLTVGAATPVGPAPVRQVICDDASVVQLLDTDQGPALKGVGPGTTLCSFVDALSMRRVYRVTVVAVPSPGPPPPPPPPPGGSK